MTSDRVQRRIERPLDQIEETADKREWDQVTVLAEDILAFAPDIPDARTFVEPGRAKIIQPARLQE